MAPVVLTILIAWALLSVMFLTDSSAQAIRIVSTTGAMPRAPLRMSRNMAS